LIKLKFRIKCNPSRLKINQFSQLQKLIKGIKEIRDIGHDRATGIHEDKGDVTNGRLPTSHHLRIYQVRRQTTDGLEGGTVSRTTDTIVIIADFN